VDAIMRSKAAFNRTTNAYEKANQHFLELRFVLDDLAGGLTQMGVKKGVDALKNLDEFRTNKGRFEAQVHDLTQENRDFSWFEAEINSISEKYSTVNQLGKDIFFAASENRPIDGMSSDFRAKLDDLRATLNKLMGKIRMTNERHLSDHLNKLIFIVVLVAFAAFVIPGVLTIVSIHQITRDLGRNVTDLYSLSTQNTATAANLKESSEILSSAANQQSASVQETVASMAEMRSMLAQTATHVKECQQMSQVAADRTHDGSRIMERMESAMVAIEQSNSQLQSLEDIINSVKEKTRVINDIVFKTQLLSFNASIEAARAGQYGRGFAVVAEEVGNLAKMSGGASREIDGMLQDSQKRVSEIIEVVRDRVRDAKTVSSEALMRFGEIAKEIISISEKINHVGEATMEQEGGIQQTARAMDQMNDTTLESKRAAEQILDIADINRGLGENIRSLTDGIHSLVGGAMGKNELTFSSRPRSSSISPPTDLEQGTIVSLIDKIAAKSSPKSESSVSADDSSFRKLK